MHLGGPVARSRPAHEELLGLAVGRDLEVGAHAMLDLRGGEDRFVGAADGLDEDVEAGNGGAGADLYGDGDRVLAGMNERQQRVEAGPAVGHGGRVDEEVTDAPGAVGVVDQGDVAVMAALQEE